MSYAKVNAVTLSKQIRPAPHNVQSLCIIIYSLLCFTMYIKRHLTES